VGLALLAAGPGVSAGLPSGLSEVVSSVRASFLGVSTHPGSSFGAGAADGWLPVSVIAARTGVTTCTLSWTPSGAAPAGLGYQVLDGGGGVLGGPVTGTGLVVTVPAMPAVTPGIRVGYGSWTSALSVGAAGPCITVPQAPTGVTAVAGSGSLTASWTPPAWDGGAAVTSATAAAAPGGATCTTAGTGCTITGLTDGTAYTVTVTATNPAGTGPASGPAAPVTPGVVPLAPSGVAATAGDTTADVTWLAPAGNGAVITGYTARAVPADPSLSTLTCTVTGTACTITGLVNGAGYAVGVRADSAAGSGAWSASVPTRARPAVLATAANRLWLDVAAPAALFADAACTTPVTAAGQPVGCLNDRSGLGHHATQSTAGQRPVAAVTAGSLGPSFDGVDDWLTFSAASLPTGTAVSTAFLVAAEDEADLTSGWKVALSWGYDAMNGEREIFKDSGTANAYVDDGGTTTLTDGGVFTSGAPQLVAAQHSGTSMSVWTAGRPGTSTAVTINTGTVRGVIGAEQWGPSFFWPGRIQEVIVLDTALTAAQRRTVETYLARKWAMPITPDPVVAPSAAVAGTTSVSVSWAAPAWNGGSAVTSYTATASPGGRTCSTAGTGCTITGLTHGTGYTVTVTATNPVGAGPASAASASVTP
jgi:hypothetical protein